MQSPKMNHIKREAYRIGRRDEHRPMWRKSDRFNTVIMVMALALLARGMA